MKEISVSEIFQFQKRFLRSANLERDFADPDALNGYIVTPQIEEYTQSISKGLSPESGKRAWRVTGDFGSGKSSFALFLANLFSNKANKLPSYIQKTINFKQIGIQHPYLLPVLVTGSREPISVALARALLSEIERLETKEGFSEVIVKLEASADSKDKYRLSDNELVSLIIDCNLKIALHSRYEGLLIIIDELGKFLEYSTLNPDKQDVYLLQQLAEVAARSKNNPLLLVGLLHQGFSSYAEHLSPTSEREWEKISERFEEIIFDHPLEQVVGLIGAALNIKQKKLPLDIKENAKQMMQKTLHLGWYGVSPSNKSVLDHTPNIYPLHPTVLPILVSVFNRFGQYQRSLFSFLMSDEPFGLMDFSKQPLREGNFYRLHNLYDYVRSTFGNRISSQSYRNHWNLIESLIDSFPASEDIEIQILKTVGLLNLIDSQKFRATEDAIIASVIDKNKGIDEDTVKKAIKTLHTEKHILHFRGSAGGYCLWAYTSVNLDMAYERASNSLNQINFQRVSSLLETYINARPIVARRHYIETGNLRHFDVHFSSVDKLKDSLNYDLREADGRIIVVLCETTDEREEALKIATSYSSEATQNVLIAIPKPLEVLGKLFQEVQRWEWIIRNTPELSADKYANQEVLRHLSVAKQTLDKRIQSLIGLYQFTNNSNLEWIYQGENIPVCNNRELVEYLSKLCDKEFSFAPRVHNELINRRVPSAVANKARTQLLSGIFESPSKPYLGMDPDKKPPEMAIYLSILKRSGIHRKTEDGYELALPSKDQDVCNLLPAFNRIKEILEVRADSRVNVSELINELSLPPYGVRNGLSPIIIAIFAVINEQHIAFYDRGTFMKEMRGLDILRFTKVPEAFEIQYCKVAGFRSEFFKRLLEVLEHHPEIGKHTTTSENGKENVLDVVRPLCIFAAELSQYTLKTKRLSKTTQSVRDVLLNAKEPATLLFKDLPTACGFTEVIPKTTPDKIEELVNVLKENITELHRAYLELHNRIFSSLLGFFELSENISVHKARETLHKRSDTLLSYVKETRLKGFCLQLCDSGLSDAEWLESLGSFVISVPPNKWRDIDEEKFIQELEVLVERFLRIESISFHKNKSEKDDLVFRLAITKPDGTEFEKIIHSSKEEEKEIYELEAKINQILESNQNLGIRVLARVFWELVAQEDKKLIKTNNS